ncbi:MAG TPA: hypothetical protein VFN68_14600 [Acidimicrobiales bacterium]|nr:hypothetical protein [Acidimicrobiales bacterium]
MSTALTERELDLLDPEEIAAGVRIIFDDFELQVSDGVKELVGQDGTVTFRWRCTVCGYVHESAEPPRWCPLCGADNDMFVPDEAA